MRSLEWITTSNGLREALGNDGDAVAWCRTRNAHVRWHSNNSVTVKVNGRQRRRPTLVQAVIALHGVLFESAAA